MYAYLSHGDGFAVLLNRVGASSGNDGYGNGGFNNVTFQAGGANGDIHWYGGGSVPTGGYEADERMDYTSSTCNNTLAAFNELNPNGSWTLFFADQSPDSTSTLTSWSVSISTVPEPTSWALGIFLAGAILAKAFQWFWRCHRRRVWQGAHVPLV